MLFTMTGERSRPDDTARLYRHLRLTILSDDGIGDLAGTMSEIMVGMVMPC
ncbi:hypothetical protein [Sphingobium sp. Z007]|uniref:hypothetical protein n=1 Tax=Sphingobium sp. Z007 TaxID=627495 RepID=UPI001595A16F|nr:hypothetical protein [Sphingobium sp. Z007]